MTSSSPCLSPLQTQTPTSRLSSSDSDCSSSSGYSPTTPTSSQVLPSWAMSYGRSPAPSSSASSSSSDDGSQSSDGSSSNVVSKEDTEPIFSSIPTRRAKSSGSISRPSGSPFACHMSSITPDTAGTVPPRRIPSFPVSKPIRPFDSISNAMGTNNKRLVPPVSRVEAPFATKETKPQTPKAMDSQTLEVKPKRSNKLLEPPKKSRFQNGFFILDMTQEEFKSRAW